jgi:hypothetical protein
MYGDTSWLALIAYPRIMAFHPFFSGFKSARIDAA